MHSGQYANTYTSEDVVARMDQAVTVMDYIRRGVRPNEQVKNVLQAIISNDVNVTVNPKITTTPTGNIYHVVGNYSSLATTIEAGNYDEKWGKAQNPEKIPLIIQPVNSFVRLVPLGEFVRNEKLFELYPRIADPMTLFTLGAQFPELQREGTIFTVWKFGNQFWCAVLGVDGGGRLVDVYPGAPGGRWSGRCRVLVRESLYFSS